MTLLTRVVQALELAEIPFALIGAAALPTLGISRSTFDLDLLGVGPSALAAETWSELKGSGIDVDLRQGDASDPLAGVVRFSSPGERKIDLVVGRYSWQRRAIDRARPLPYEGVLLPVVRGEDLILLKLFAGGPQDAWDVRQVLAGPQHHELIAAVERDLGDLPPDARRMWKQVLEA